MALLLPHCSSATASPHPAKTTYAGSRTYSMFQTDKLQVEFPRIVQKNTLSYMSLSVSHTTPSSSSSSDPSLLVSSVGTPPLVPSSLLMQWNLDSRHVLVLNVIACIAGISASWLFFTAIPTLLAFKRAAESLEKLLDVTRDELPDTMAAVRLSGMEISDLTMELSDLGQEITQGVRSSTRAVRLAEDRLRRLTMTSADSIQVQTTQARKSDGPVLARNARNIREVIVRGRSMMGLLSSLTRFSHLAWSFLSTRGQKPVS